MIALSRNDQGTGSVLHPDPQIQRLVVDSVGLNGDLNGCILVTRFLALTFGVNQLAGGNLAMFVPTCRRSSGIEDGVHPFLGKLRENCG